MSWAAMNYVRRLKRESGIVGNVRLVLLMIAWRIPKGCLESRPIPVAFLVRDTCLDRKTVRECIKKAVRSGHVRVGTPGGPGRGNAPSYVMPHLAGPLFMLGDEKGGEAPLFDRDGKGGESPPFPDRKKGGDSPLFRPEKGEFRPGPVRTNSVRTVRTRKTTTAGAKPAAAATYVSALEFLDWFSAGHLEHRKAQTTIDIEADGPVVARLLTSPVRSVELLQSMALVMWTVTAAEDPWLPSAKERGIRLLAHAADRLERIAVERRDGLARSRPPCLYKHAPPCESASACAALERRLVEARDREEAIG